MNEPAPTEAAPEARFPEIGDYAIIGNCRGAALVSRDGALEWLCLPAFSSPSLFAAILDRGAGHFFLRPRGGYRTERSYLSGTNVLQTDFHCEERRPELPAPVAAARVPRPQLRLPHAARHAACARPLRRDALSALMRAAQRY